MFDVCWICLQNIHTENSPNNNVNTGEARKSTHQSFDYPEFYEQSFELTTAKRSFVEHFFLSLCPYGKQSQCNQMENIGTEKMWNVILDFDIKCVTFSGQKFKCDNSKKNRVYNSSNARVKKEKSSLKSGTELFSRGKNRFLFSLEEKDAFLVGWRGRERDYSFWMNKNSVSQVKSGGRRRRHYF